MGGTANWITAANDQALSTYYHQKDMVKHPAFAITGDAGCAISQKNTQNIFFDHLNTLRDTLRWLVTCTERYV